jgi:hypothetical protein
MGVAMSNPKDGGPAFAGFPDELTACTDRDGVLDRLVPVGREAGMSIRDYFASRAMASFIAGDPPRRKETVYTGYSEGIAAAAYRVADAMLAASATPVAELVNPCDLLQALKNVERWLEGVDLQKVGDTFYAAREALKIARTAIAGAVRQ